MITTNVSPTIAWICGTALLLAVLGGVFALVWHGSITGVEALSVVGTILAAAVGMLGVHAGVAMGAKSALNK